MEEDSAHSELQYQDRSGNKEVVWPFIVDEVINDDTAVLIGMLESETGFRGIHIFAFQPSGPVVDITDGVLEMAAKERQESFEHLLKASPTAGVSTLKKQDRWVAIGITSTDWSSEIRLSWIQISDMVREAKQTGITRKDLASGTTYMEKKFKPEVQK